SDILIEHVYGRLPAGYHQSFLRRGSLPDAPPVAAVFSCSCKRPEAKAAVRHRAENCVGRSSRSTSPPPLSGFAGVDRLLCCCGPGTIGGALSVPGISVAGIMGGSVMMAGLILPCDCIWERRPFSADFPAQRTVSFRSLATPLRPRSGVPMPFP